MDNLIEQVVDSMINGDDAKAEELFKEFYKQEFRKQLEEEPDNV